MKTLFATAAIAAITLTACASTVSPSESATAAPTPTPIVIYVTPKPTETPVDAPTSPPEEPTPDPTPAGATTVARGKAARAGDWDVKVTGKVNFDAWAVIKRENMFNDKNPAGTKMVLVPISVTNRGPEAATLLGDAGYVVGNATGVEIHDFDDPYCGVIPKELDQFKTVRPGGTLAGNMCFVVPNADIATLRLGWPADLFSDDPDVEFALR